MDRDLVLGLDVGTSRSKALLLDATGAEVAVATAPTPFAGPFAGPSAGPLPAPFAGPFVAAGGRIEMPVEALLGATAALVATLGDARSRVAAVGIAGMAECGAPLDAARRPLAPVIAWHDPRGGEVAERLAARFGDDLALRTGQRPRPVSTVAKLGWLVEHGVAGVDRWLGVPELVLSDLTGAEATEHSLASRTGCWDVLDMTWLPEVAEAAGFTPGVFAPVRAAGAAMGRLDPASAARWGLPAGVPVTLAGHDHLAGAAGVGAGPGDLVNSVGTAETVLGTTPTPPSLRRAVELRTPVSVAPGGQNWVVLGGAARAGLVLESAARLLGLPMAELDALADGAEAAELSELSEPVDGAGLAAALQAGERPVLPGAPPGAIWLGLLRAMAARTAETAARVAQLVPAERLLVIGGGSGSRPWMRLKSERIHLPVLRPRTRQAAARGAAVFAGQAAGWWDSPAAAPGPGADAV